MVAKPSAVLKFALPLAVIVGIGLLLSATAARADTPLNRAIVQSLRNSVQLLLKNQSPRPARVRDAMSPGDALTTARAALAELQFNDGSLARVGERALFRFLPNTRTFQLNNGTLLLLIPPGRGRTRVQTPNAAAGIRGSALFVRYLPDSDTTLVGALTQSGIEISNRDRSQNQPLNAGQVAVIVRDKIQQIYNFDLRTFYETSAISQGLNLSGQAAGSPANADIGMVQAETRAAVAAQAPITNAIVIRDPALLEQAPTTVGGITDDSVFHLDPSSLLETTTDTLADPALLTPTALTIFEHPAIGHFISLPPQIALPIQPGITPGLGDTGLPGLLDPAVQAGGNPASVPRVNTIGPIINPGRGITIAPGQTGTAPGSTGNSVGRGVIGAPGQTGTAPGLAGTTPGRGGSGPPGQTGTAPGLAGTAPGRGGSGPPGQTGAAPGQAGTTPGQAGQ